MRKDDVGPTMRIIMGEGYKAVGRVYYSVTIYRGNPMNYWRSRYDLGLAEANELYRGWLLMLQSHVVAPMSEDELIDLATAIEKQVNEMYRSYGWGAP